HRFPTSPSSRSTRFPFTPTASPPAPLAIRKAPRASVESIEPRPPQPSEVGRPKGRRRKSRRQSHKFFKHLLRLAPQLARHALGRLPTPAPSARKSATQTAQKTALCTPREHPGGFGIRGSRSRPPLRRPRPLRFERLRVPVWNPYSRGRLGPAKSEDRSEEHKA